MREASDASVSQQHGKLISLGTMAAGLAHELNNPAAAIGRSAAEAREAFREASEKAAELEVCPSLKDNAPSSPGFRKR